MWLVLPRRLAPPLLVHQQRARGLRRRLGRLQRLARESQLFLVQVRSQQLVLLRLERQLLQQVVPPRLVWLPLRRLVLLQLERLLRQRPLQLVHWPPQRQLEFLPLPPRQLAPLGQPQSKY